jgi:glycerol-3-phosphate dehydrogenase subunit C
VDRKKVAFFIGCYVNYYNADIGKALLKVLDHNEVQYVIPPFLCCALPMISKGNTKSAIRNMKFNIETLSKAIKEEGCEYVVVSCTSCGLMIKESYPRFVNSPDAKLVADKTLHIGEYLMMLAHKGELKKDFRKMPETVFYHLPCHMRGQGDAVVDDCLQLMRLVPELTIGKVGRNCCGMGGTWGFEAPNFPLSWEIGNKIITDIKENPTDRVVTDCGLCTLRIETGAGVKVFHPVQVLQEAYGV